jgi:predicted XRE-type DNA-binding protein
MTKKSNFIKGSGNVYADLGMKDADEMFAKARLASEIVHIMEERDLTQQKAAKLLGTTQAKISDIVRGQFRSFTMDRLIQMLLDFDRDVEISYKPKPRSRDHAIMTVHPA